jgi:hypothetical protein
MRFRLIAGVFALVLVTNAHAQWTTNADPTLAGKAGIGGPIHSSARLRITEVPGVVTNGPFHLAFGPDSGSMYWGFRMDASYNLHLDRQGYSGWAEGFVFNRDGNFGIGTVTPTEILHATRDQNAGTIMRLSNSSNGAAAYTSLRFTEGSTNKAEIKSASSGAAAPDTNALYVTNIANGPAVFATNNAERMRIFADGKVAIGSTAYNPGKLTVLGTATGGYGIMAQQRSAATVNGAAQNDTGLWVETIQDIPSGVLNNGGLQGGQLDGWNWGPGTVYFATGGNFHAGIYGNNAGTVNFAFGVQSGVKKGSGTILNGMGVYIHDTEATNDYGVYQVGADDANYFAGNVVIGGPPTTANTYALAVEGNANFNGTVTGTNIKANYQDVAEWVPSTTDLEPGTVVILNRERDNEVMASATAYDTTVAGVVSAQPGLSLGIEGAGKEQVATTGRVRVRVDARSKPIRVGDLLVTSDLPGTAMRSEPMQLNGRPFHQPGTIIGKALQSIDSGVGEILVLLSMQ